MLEECREPIGEFSPHHIRQIMMMTLAPHMGRSTSGAEISMHRPSLGDMAEGLR